MSNDNISHAASHAVLMKDNPIQEVLAVSNVLECKNLSKDYSDGSTVVKVLNNLELKVKQGESVAIMGRSGSGKTTLLQMLGGLDLPTQGEVWVDGQNLQNMNERNRSQMRNRSLGFIFQLHHLLPEFTALENVCLPLLIADVSPNEARLRSAELLEAMGLADRLEHKPAELSGGERQRVAIARALVNRPSCILADEPTGNLDDETAAQVFEIFESINKTYHTSIVMVTHDPILASRLDRKLVLQGGHLV